MAIDDLQSLKGTFQEQLRNSRKNLHTSARVIYMEMAEKLRKVDITGNKILSDTESGHMVTRVTANEIGRLCMFYYNPKHRETLPYYDRFPMIMPIRMDPKGFLGINFHYLPHKQRAILMDVINEKIIKNKRYITDRKKIQMSYAIMKRTIKSPLYVPTIHQYLYSHVKSRLYMVEHELWNIALFLPLERFEKATKGRVHMESLRKIRQYGNA